MKIIEIIPNLNSGGAEKFVVDLTNELHNQGHDIILLTLFDITANDILQTFLKENLKKCTLNKQAGFDIKCLFRLLKFILKEKPDVVHAHTGGIIYLILSVFPIISIDFINRCYNFSHILLKKRKKERTYTYLHYICIFQMRR